MKNYHANFLVVAVLILIQGCTVQKTLQATGGSKSDGVIALSYEFGMFEQPAVDWADGLEKAKQRCASWGYSDAELFGGTISQCQA